jgi:hypothetical protein
MRVDRKRTRPSVPPRARALNLAFALACVLGGLAGVAGGCGQDSAIVGGTCAASYTQCGQACVDLETDPANCGACGHKCPAGVSCVAGSCGGVTDGSSDVAHDSVADTPVDNPLGEGSFREGGDAGDGADAPTDATPTDSGPTDSQPTDGLLFDGCAPTDAGLVCPPLCDPDGGLTDCAGQCVDEQNDPFNCGACGKICNSNLCIAGLCQGATPGDIVVIGHDYFTVQGGSAQARVVSNAVLLPSSNPLRILSFEQYAAAPAVNKVTSVLTTAAMAQNRMLNVTHSVTASDIPNNLTITSFDVLLVYDQASAPSGTMAMIGASWLATLTTYLGKGGIVVVLDGASGTGEMPQFETSSSLLAVTSHTSMPPGTPVHVIAPADAVGFGVLSPYGVTRHSGHYLTTEANGGNVIYVVVEPVSGEPVVVHKIVP